MLPQLCGALKVGDIVLLYLFQNILVFVMIFWLLTWGGEYFYKVKNHAAKKQFYECGFKTISDLNIQININFAMLCIFLILYDVEFIFLFPFLFNVGVVGFFQVLIFFIFIILILMSLFYDWQTNALSWQF